MSKHNQKNSLLWLIIVALVAVIAVMAFMMMKDDPADETIPTGINGEEFAETEDPGIAVENPYMTYYYASDLSDEITVETTTDSDRHEAAFLTEINGEKLELFRIILGKGTAENGYVLGTLGKDIQVTLVMNEQHAEDWSEEDFTRINTLQERINDIIPQFYADSRFTANR